MQAVALGCLLVKHFLQVGEVPRACSEELFLQSHLNHNILVSVAGSIRESGEIIFVAHAPTIACDNAPFQQKKGGGKQRAQTHR